MNHYITQSYYEIVDGKYKWHWEPVELQELRSEIEVADWGIRYYTLEDSRPDKLRDNQQRRAAAVAKFEEIANGWRASNDGT